MLSTHLPALEREERTRRLGRAPIPSDANSSDAGACGPLYFRLQPRIADVVMNESRAEVLASLTADAEAFVASHGADLDKIACYLLTAATHPERLTSQGGADALARLCGPAGSAEAAALELAALRAEMRQSAGRGAKGVL